MPFASLTAAALLASVPVPSDTAVGLAPAETVTRAPSAIGGPRFSYGRAALELGAVMGLGVTWYETQIELNKKDFDFQRSWSSQWERIATCHSLRWLAFQVSPSVQSAIPSRAKSLMRNCPGTAERAGKPPRLGSQTPGVVTTKLRVVRNIPTARALPRVHARGESDQTHNTQTTIQRSVLNRLRINYLPYRRIFRLNHRTGGGYFNYLLLRSNSELDVDECRLIDQQYDSGLRM